MLSNSFEQGHIQQKHANMKSENNENMIKYESDQTIKQINTNE